MRDAFSEELTNLAGSDPRIVLLMGDIGNHMFDRFKDSILLVFLIAALPSQI